jgi:hypothetical protein
MVEEISAGVLEEYFVDAALSSPVAPPPSMARAFTHRLRL